MMMRIWSISFSSIIVLPLVPLVLLGLLVLLGNSASKTQVRRNSSKVEISAGDLTLGDIVEGEGWRHDPS